jgi:predicted secreted Zn-dependent protease
VARRLGAAALLAALLVAAASASAKNRPPLARPEAGLTVLARYHYYLVHGATADAIRADLDRHGLVDPSGGRYDARTDWYVRWQYGERATSHGCKVADAKTSVRIDYHLPRWAPPRQPDPALVRRWNRYTAALGVHEEGHAVNGVTTARDILHRLARFSTTAGCAVLGVRANAAASREIAAGNARDRGYDSRTDHGATQGARFP